LATSWRARCRKKLSPWRRGWNVGDAERGQEEQRCEGEWYEQREQGGAAGRLRARCGRCRTCHAMRQWTEADKQLRLASTLQNCKSKGAPRRTAVTTPSPGGRHCVVHFPFLVERQRPHRYVRRLADVAGWPCSPCSARCRTRRLRALRQVDGRRRRSGLRRRRSRAATKLDQQPPSAASWTCQRQRRCAQWRQRRLTARRTIAAVTTGTAVAAVDGASLSTFQTSAAGWMSCFLPLPHSTSYTLTTLVSLPPFTTYQRYPLNRNLYSALRKL
jgi:hypothetical protein